MINHKQEYRLTPGINLYDGITVKSSLHFKSVSLQPGRGSAELFTADGLWQCAYEVHSVSDRPDALDVIARFRLKEGVCASAGVVLELKRENWSTDNYVIIPGTVYGGNRFRSFSMDYPPLFDPSRHRLDMPITVTDIPRLQLGDGPSFIEQTTGDAATPAMGFQDPHHQLGCWILTKQATHLGNLGLGIRESDDRQTAWFSVSSPCVRKHRQAICQPRPSTDYAAEWKSGDEMLLNIRIYLLTASHLIDLLRYFMEIRTDMAPKAVFACELPLSKAWEILEDKYNRDNWRQEKGYYAVGTGDGINDDWQVGWIGGCMVTHPLIFAGQAISCRRACTNIETVLSRGQAPSGFLYGLSNGRDWYGDGFYKAHPLNMHLVRKSGDALYFLMKQLLALRERGWGDMAGRTWLDAVSRLADAFKRLWKEYGQIGQFVDVENGRLLVGGSMAGAIVPAALTFAGRYFKNKGYTETACEIAQAYYEKFRATGITNGAPGDILQAPDSESAFALLESFIVLYEETLDFHWLLAAEQAAHLCMTWCVSYDYEFPKNSLFARLKIHSAGAVIANAQNKHAAPGICTLSGDSLLKLYRATQNEHYLRQLQSIVRNLPQYISREDRPLGSLPAGWINERVNLSDWEEVGMVGEVLHMSSWPEVSCMLSWLEVPGLYIRPDLRRVYSFDAVDGRVLPADGDNIRVRVHNPTCFHASVRVLVEEERHTRIPLGITSILKTPRIELRPEESKVIEWIKNTETLHEISAKASAVVDIPSTSSSVYMAKKK